MKMGGEIRKARPMIHACAELDRVEAAAWDRLGGPIEADFMAIRVVEREIGYRLAETREVALWRVNRLRRAIDNDWDVTLLRLLRSAINRDAARFSEPVEQRTPAGKPHTSGPQTKAHPSEVPRNRSTGSPIDRACEMRESGKLAYSIKEAAAAAALSKSALYEDIAAGLLATKKRGARTLIAADELLRYLSNLPSSRRKSDC